MKNPNSLVPEDIIYSNMKKEIDHKWVPCRFEAYKAYGFFHRWICAWKVFTGQADIVEWYKQ